MGEGEYLGLSVAHFSPFPEAGAQRCVLAGVGLVDLTTPGAGGGAALLDEALEVLQIALDLAVVEAERASDLLGRSLRLPANLDRHARLIVAQAVERHNTRVLLTGRAPPRHALVRNLLGHDGVILLGLAVDADLPVQVRIAELLYLLDSVHELWERFELCPLVVRRPHGHVHIDPLRNLCHYQPPSGQLQTAPGCHPFYKCR